MKKTISLLLALLMCLSLCACGGDGKYAKYEDLINYLEAGQFDQAYAELDKLANKDGEPTDSTHSHTWKDATCDTPATCTTCGMVVGDPQHQFVNKSCAEPEVCELCGAVGQLGRTHFVLDGDCSRCGMTAEEIEIEPASRYIKAMDLLSSAIKHPSETYATKAYSILVELGDYRDAKDYLNRFKMLEDVRLSWYYEEKNAFGEISQRSEAVYKYNALGFCTEQPLREFFAGDIEYYFYVYVYNEDGKILEKHRDKYTYAYTYDDAGVLLETKTLSGATTYSITTHIYNELGQKVRDEMKYADGKENVITYDYDAFGNLIRMEEPQIEGNRVGVVDTTIYEYDTSGRLIRSFKSESEHSGSTNLIPVENIYTYDSEGNLSQHICIGDKWYKCEVYYTYENGKLVNVKYIYTDYEYENGEYILNYVNEYITNYTYGNYYFYIPAE